MNDNSEYLYLWKRKTVQRRKLSLRYLCLAAADYIKQADSRNMGIVNWAREVISIKQPWKKKPLNSKPAKPYSVAHDGVNNLAFTQLFFGGLQLLSTNF